MRPTPITGAPIARFTASEVDEPTRFVYQRRDGERAADAGVGVGTDVHGIEARIDRHLRGAARIVEGDAVGDVELRAVHSAPHREVVADRRGVCCTTSTSSRARCSSAPP